MSARGSRRPWAAQAMRITVCLCRLTGVVRNSPTGRHGATFLRGGGCLGALPDASTRAGFLAGKSAEHSGSCYSAASATSRPAMRSRSLRLTRRPFCGRSCTGCRLRRPLQGRHRPRAGPADLRLQAHSSPAPTPDWGSISFVKVGANTRSLLTSGETPPSLAERFALANPKAVEGSTLYTRAPSSSGIKRGGPGFYEVSERSS